MLALNTSNDRLPTGTTVTLGDGTTNDSGILKLDSRSQQLAGLLTAGTGTNRVSFCLRRGQSQGGVRFWVSGLRPLCFNRIASPVSPKWGLELPTSTGVCSPRKRNAIPLACFIRSLIL